MTSIRPLTQLFVCAAVLCIAGCATQSKVGEASTSFDGLERRQSNAVDELWVRRFFDVRTYSRILFAPPKIEYRHVPVANASTSTAFPLSAEQKASLTRIVTAAFQQELAHSSHFPMATLPGPDVLVVRGDLLDVVSHVPPGAGQTSAAPTSIGEATLVIEVRDSVSDSIMVRAIERVTAERTQGNAATTAADVERTARAWAGLLRERLDTIASVDLNP